MSKKQNDAAKLPPVQAEPPKAGGKKWREITSNVDGFYEPVAGEVFECRVHNRTRFKGGSNGIRDVFVVTLDTPCTGYRSGENEPSTLNPGERMAIDLRAGMTELSYYFDEARAHGRTDFEARITCKGKRETNAGQQFWLFGVQVAE